MPQYFHVLPQCIPRFPWISGGSLRWKMSWKMLSFCLREEKPGKCCGFAGALDNVFFFGTVKRQYPWHVLWEELLFRVVPSIFMTAVAQQIMVGIRTLRFKTLEVSWKIPSLLVGHPKS